MAGSKAVAVIPAAGEGKRMGKGPKALVPLLGRPLLSRTLQVFQDCERISAIYVAAPPELKEEIQSLVAREQFSKVRGVILGGETRQESVHHCLQAIAASLNGSASLVLVAVHDAARSLLPLSLLEEILEEAGKGDAACLLGIPVKDTIKEVREGVVLSTPERSSLWMAQTPQVAPLPLLEEAYERARDEGVRGTDEAMLIERMGHPVRIIEGDEENIKITTPEDLRHAEWILQERETAAPSRRWAASLMREFVDGTTSWKSLSRFWPATKHDAVLLFLLQALSTVQEEYSSLSEPARERADAQVERIIKRLERGEAVRLSHVGWVHRLLEEAPRQKGCRGR